MRDDNVRTSAYRKAIMALAPNRYHAMLRAVGVSSVCVSFASLEAANPRRVEAANPRRVVQWGMWINAQFLSIYRETIDLMYSVAGGNNLTSSPAEGGASFASFPGCQARWFNALESSQS